MVSATGAGRQSIVAAKETKPWNVPRVWGGTPTIAWADVVGNTP